MKDYNTQNIRNIAILGHLGSGKTSFGEALLYAGKAIDKKGEVERKSTVGDYSVEEQTRQTTLISSLLPLEWKGYKFNFLDTPGSEEFIGDIENVLSAVDAAVLLVDATKGVEVGTERVWEELTKRSMPTIIFVNKMDKENVKFEEVVDEIKAELSKNAVPLAWEIGTTNNFKGLANVLTKKAKLVDGSETDLPGEVTDKVEEIYGELLEKVAETSEELMDKYFGGEELTAEEINGGLKQELISGDLYPVLLGSGLKNVGVSELLDTVINLVPSPNEGKGRETKDGEKKAYDENAPFSAVVFKTTIDPFQGTISYFKVITGSLKAGQEVYLPKKDAVIKMAPIFTAMGKNQLPLDTVYAGDIACAAKVSEFVNGLTFCDKKNPVQYKKVEHPTPIIYVAISPKNKQDEDKLSSSLNKLKLEDETFETIRNPETAQQLLGGQGMTHIGYVLEKLRNMFKVDVVTADPKIVYRETIRAKAEAQGKHKKQSGGAGQYGDVHIRFEPCEEKFIFAEEVVGGAVPKNYFPAVEKGLIETLEHGPLAGFPVIGVRAVLYDGSYHPVDSNEISFKIAAALSFKEACKTIKPTILEPVMEVVVTVKDEYVGDIMGDTTKRRGAVIGMQPVGNGKTAITCNIPEAEIVSYATDLKAMTQGSGRFTRSFLRYDDVPEHLVAKIIEEYKPKQ